MVKIMRGIRQLAMFPESGVNVSSQYNIDSDYSYIFIEHNYFFYSIKDKEAILILEMFHEREDFMRKLFGIVTTSQETIDYWGE